MFDVVAAITFPSPSLFNAVKPVNTHVIDSNDTRCGLSVEMHADSRQPIVHASTFSATVGENYSCKASGMNMFPEVRDTDILVLLHTMQKL